MGSIPTGSTIPISAYGTRALLCGGLLLYLGQGAEFQEETVITKVKCTTKGCDLENQVLTTTALYLNRIAPLDGPFICPRCEKPMKVVDRIPANYKGNSGAKTMPRRISARLVTKRPSTAGRKRKSKGTKIKITGTLLGYRKSPKKAGTKRPGQRKRGPSKS